MLELSKKYIIGCSGGADSMALLDMLTKQNLNLVVCHVNYNQRESSIRDQNIVEEYCALNRIPCFVLQDYHPGKPNFEGHAREVRYQYFAKIAKEEMCDAVIVAHQKDDDLETYLLQKERGIVPRYYGLSPQVELSGLVVIRPLLAYTKAELEQYCIDYQIQTGYDETNDSDIFARNRLRKRLLSTSEDQKSIWHQEAQERNKIKKAYEDQISKASEKFLELKNVEEFSHLDQEIRADVLRLFISENTSLNDDKSPRWLDEVSHQILNNQNLEVLINTEWKLVVSYGMMTIEKVVEDGFHFKFNRDEVRTTPYFEIREEGQIIEGVTLNDLDFPLIFRNPKPGDRIQLRYGTKKINRFLIDRKISRKSRNNWLVIENGLGNIIFVQGIGCDVAHFSNNPTIFVIK